MQANPEGVEPLIQAMDELKVEIPPAKRTLTLKPSSEKGALKSIKLIFSPETDEINFMSISVDGDTAIIKFTEAGMINIYSSLEEWRNGSEDFCLFPRGKKSELKSNDLESLEIWFWSTMMP